MKAIDANPLFDQKDTYRDEKAMVDSPQGTGRLLHP